MKYVGLKRIPILTWQEKTIANGNLYILGKKNWSLIICNGIHE